MLDLDLLGLRHGQAQPVGNIGGDVVAAYRQHGGVPHVAIDVNGHVGGAAADIADHHAHLALGLGQHHFGGGQRVEHELGNLHAGRAHALAQVLHAGGGGGDDMGLHLQAVAVHADRHADAFLPVHVKAALDDVDDLAVVRDGDRPGGVHGAGNVVLVDDPPGNPDHARGC